MGRIVSCYLEKSELQFNNVATGTSSHDFDKTWGWGFGPQGSLHSFMCPSLDKYSVFGAHVKSVVGLLGAAEGILSVSSDYVRMHTRGGVPILTFRWLRSEISLIRKCAIQGEMSSLVTICQVTGWAQSSYGLPLMDVWPWTELAFNSCSVLWASHGLSFAWGPL